MTEEVAKPPPIPVETEKVIIPSDEEEKLSTKDMILSILGYISLIFVVIALFFPFWNWYDTSNSTYHYISLWRGTSTTSGIPYFHWEVVVTYISNLINGLINPQNGFPSFGRDTIWAIVGVNFSLVFIILLIYYIWKRKFPKTVFFTFSIILGALFGVGFPLSVDFPFISNGETQISLYGATWGLAFGWWALFISGIIGLIRKLYLDKLMREKKEAEGL